MLQILIYGAVSSAIYAMLAVGFTLIFGVARILNLAHGSFYALGAYSAFTMTSLLSLPLLVAAPLSVLVVALFGVAMERFLVRPLRQSQLAVLMITLAVSLAVEQALFLIFGSEYRNVPSFIAEKIAIGGVDISGQRLLALTVGVAVLLMLWLIIQRTRLGAAILAVSQDPRPRSIWAFRPIASSRSSWPYRPALRRWRASWFLRFSPFSLQWACCRWSRPSPS